MKMIAAPVDPAAHRQLKILAAELGEKSEALIREALRDLFVKHGKPPIA
jgi:predicted transcriptional regulator